MSMNVKEQANKHLFPKSASLDQRQKAQFCMRGDENSGIRLRPPDPSPG